MKARLFALFLAIPAWLTGLDAGPLLPGLEPIPAIEFDLPGNFVMRSRGETPNLEEGVFWGEAGTLKSYFKGKRPLKSSIIAVKHSPTVTQTGPNDFEGDKGFHRELKRLGGRKLTIKKYRWGNYPVLSIYGMSHGGTRFRLAWIGLNDPDGKTILLSFLCPDEKNKPTDEELALWQNLLENSKGIN